MKQNVIVRSVIKLALVTIVGLTVACSSSSGGGTADTTISGTIVAAPVNGADVIVIDANGNEVVKAVKTNADGHYTLVIPNGSLAQDLIVKSTGGTFVDEATGNNGTAGEMVAYVSANSISNGSSVSATPGSTIIAKLVLDPDNGITTQAEAEAVFSEAFGYTPDVSVKPVDATDLAAIDASEASRLEGLRAAAFSQLANDLGLLVTEQFGMFTALAQDLSDRTLDGVGKDNVGTAVPVTLTINGNSGSPLVVDIQNRYTAALLNFHDNKLTMPMMDKHGDDQTGLTSVQIAGEFSFAKVALTNNGDYKIQYIPGNMSAMEGKTTFKLQITDKNGKYVSTAKPELMPKMYMVGMAHTTPVTDVTYDGADGMYTATIYYLMPSMMRGYWDFKVDVDGDMSATKTDVAYFYPNVMMPMSDTTSLVKLQGVDDTVMSMITNAPMGRPYRIFKDSLVNNGGNSYDFSVFVVAQENMMSFPAVFDTSLLNGKALDATVEFSGDDGVNWTKVTDGANGIWSVSGLTVTGDGIRVRLTVNDGTIGEVKTTDGLLAVEGDNDYQTFFFVTQ